MFVEKTRLKFEEYHFFGTNTFKIKLALIMYAKNASFTNSIDSTGLLNVQG